MVNKKYNTLKCSRFLKNMPRVCCTWNSNIKNSNTLNFIYSMFINFLEDQCGSPEGTLITQNKKVCLILRSKLLILFDLEIEDKFCSILRSKKT